MFWLEGVLDALTLVLTPKTEYDAQKEGFAEEIKLADQDLHR